MDDPWKRVNHEYRAEETLLCDKWNNKWSMQKDMSFITTENSQFFFLLPQAILFASYFSIQHKTEWGVYKPQLPSTPELPNFVLWYLISWILSMELASYHTPST